MISTKQNGQDSSANDSRPFIPERLTEAREAMGLNISSLAKLIGVSHQAVSDYEAGKKQPNSEKFVKICQILDQPSQFFFHSNVERNYVHSLVHFRANQSLRPDARAMAGIRLKWMMEYYSVLKRKLTLPELNLPNFNMPRDPAMISRDMIEDAAMELRKFWKIGEIAPLPHLIRLLELNGAVVSLVALDLPKMDGASIWSESHNRPFVLLNSDKASYVRSRFDVAHELGHMLLHRGVVEGITLGSPVYKQMENQAHMFASTLLLPRDAWLRDVRERKFTLAVFKALKPKWRASIFSMIMRAEALKEISPDRKAELIKQLSSRKWRVREPYDELWEIERPKLFDQSTRMLAHSRVGARFITQAFPRRSENTGEITGLPKAFFNIETLPIKFGAELDTSTLN